MRAHVVLPASRRLGDEDLERIAAGDYRANVYDEYQPHQHEDGGNYLRWPHKG